jgi:DNA-binding XRE family transcriptional regulator
VADGGRLADQLGRILEDARGSRSLRGMAADVDLSHATLHALENGQDNPTLERVEQIAAAYGVRLEIVEAR